MHPRNSNIFKWDNFFVIEPTTSKGKSKAIPLEASTDHTGSRRLRFTHFKTIGT